MELILYFSLFAVILITANTIVEWLSKKSDVHFSRKMLKTILLKLAPKMRLTSYAFVSFDTDAYPNGLPEDIDKQASAVFAKIAAKYI